MSAQKLVDLAQLLALLRLIARPGGAALADVQRAVGLSRATTYRYLRTAERVLGIRCLHRRDTDGVWRWRLLDPGLLTIPLPVETRPTSARRRWSAADDAALSELRQRKERLVTIAAALGRTQDAVANRCRKLGLTAAVRRGRSEQRWTTAEIQRLREYHSARASTKRTAQALGRSRSAVQERRKMLGLRYHDKTRWTASDEADLRRSWIGGEAAESIAARLGRTENAVRRRAQILRLAGHRRRGRKPGVPQKPSRPNFPLRQKPGRPNFSRRQKPGRPNFSRRQKPGRPNFSW